MITFLFFILIALIGLAALRSVTFVASVAPPEHPFSWRCPNGKCKAFVHSNSADWLKGYAENHQHFCKFRE